MNFATPNAAQNLFYYRNGPNAKHSAELPAGLLQPTFKEYHSVYRSGT